MLRGEEWKDLIMPSARIETRLKEACSMDDQSVCWSVSHIFIYLFG